MQTKHISAVLTALLTAAALILPVSSRPAGAAGERETLRAEILDSLVQTQENTPAWDAVSRGTEILPVQYMRAFLDLGWKVVVTERTDGGWDGLASETDRTIYLRPEADLFVFCHEFGHFTASVIDRDDFFEQLYQKEKSAPVLRDYAAINHYEFFADCFAVTLLGGEEAAVLAEQAPLAVSFIRDGILGTDSPPSSAWFVSTPFEDVPPDSWYFEPVARVSEAGLMKGVSSTRFDPLGPADRSMAAAVLWRLAGEPAPAGPVSGTSWHAAAVSWVMEEGIAAGCSGEDFRPDSPVTREELITMLHRTAMYIGEHGLQGDISGILFFRGDLSVFSDASAISSWAEDAASWGLAAGLMTGTGDSRFAPGACASRAELAALLDRWQTALAAGRVTVQVEHAR